jgi:hypothetical protein
MPPQEHLEQSEDKALAGDATHDMYSMGGSTADHEAETEPDKKQSHSAKEPEKKNHEILYWRLGIGLAIILIITGLIFFIGKGINWGINKVAGQKNVVTPYVSTLRSNADPNDSRPSGPVVSNMNIIPVSSAANGTGTSAATPSNGTSSTGSVAGASIMSNNCPTYTDTEYYYCEWVDRYTFRPYRTKEEYEGSKLKTTAPRVTTQTTPSITTYTQPTYSQPVNSYPTTTTAYSPTTSYPSTDSNTVLPNGCPSYTADEYVRCVWIDKYTFRGFRAGE